MKVIDLFNKIANGEEVPFEIKLFGVTFYFDNEKQCYFSKYDKGNILDMHSHLLRNKGKSLLNEEVEIIEDTPKEDKKIEKTNREDISLGASLVNEKIRNIDCYIFDKLDEIIDKVNGE